MIKILNKIFAICLTLGMLFCCGILGCAGDNIPEKGEEDKDAVQIIFFDIMNDVAEDGKSFTHLYGSNDNSVIPLPGVKPYDCYLIKHNNSEILVDAGFPLNGSNECIRNIYGKHFITKLKKYCSDGILEFLVVTHADFDHIAGLATNDGVFDYCIKNDDLKIGTIIDFDSDLVKAFSAPGIIPSLGNENLLIKTEIAKSYRQKRSLLEDKKETKAFAAADFFDDESLTQDNKNTALPEFLRQKHENNSLLCNFFWADKGKIKRNDIKKDVFGNVSLEEEIMADVGRKKDFSYLKGELKSDNGKFYYSIPLEGEVEFRILYNWSYDHIFKHSFEQKFDSQDCNNISVCIEIVNKSNKFVALGDLGRGETGLINYYHDCGDIFNDVSCFKASHHGSINNGENSEQLLNLLKADYVIVPNIAQPSRSNLNSIDQTNDPLYGSLNNVPALTEDFINNVLKSNSSAKIYLTEAIQLIDSEESNINYAFRAVPLYGDITVNLYKQRADAYCSYKGEVNTYISSLSEEDKQFKFNVVNDNGMISYEKTELFNKLFKKEEVKQ